MAPMLQDTPQMTPDASLADAGQSVCELIELREALEQMRGELKFSKTRIEALNFEIARLKRWRLGQSSESLDGPKQDVLFEQIVLDTGLENVAAQEERKPPHTRSRGAVRQALAAHLPRIDHHHELTETACQCGAPLKRIGQDVSEQLDCVPAQFFVHRHIRGKYACACCQSIKAAALPAQIIDKGIPAPGLLAQVVVAKHDDHLPLYRQEEIYVRSGVHIPRSSMAQWVGICGVRLEPLAQALRDFILSHAVIHADETPVAVLSPGKGKTHKAYMWVYRTTDYVTARAVWFDFCAGRGGEHPQRVLKDYTGTMVTDHYAAYKSIYAKGAIIEAGCMAHYHECSFIWSEANWPQRSCGPSAVRTPHKFGLLTVTARTRACRPWVSRSSRLSARCRPFPKRLHGLSLHLQIGRDVAAGRGDTGVAKVVADHRHVGSGLQ